MPRRSKLGPLAQNLRRLRNALGFTTFGLADAAGISRQTVIGIELGYAKQQDTKLSTIVALAKALKCTVADLIDAPASEPKSAARKVRP